jgi:chromate transporter
MAPGINLAKLTALIGHKLRGWLGLTAAMTGLLLPSALVTVLMTAGFSAIRDVPLVKAAMRGILPATIGLGLAMALQMGQPLFQRAFREGPARVAISLAMLVASALLMGVGRASPVLVMLLAGVAAILLLAWVPESGPRPKDRKAEKEGAA